VRDGEGSGAALALASTRLPPGSREPGLGPGGINAGSLPFRVQHAGSRDGWPSPRWPGLGSLDDAGRNRSRGQGAVVPGALGGRSGWSGGCGNDADGEGRAFR
jgi:hypothetical protein